MAAVVMVCGVKVEPSPAVFSYQTILLSSSEAERTSRSPSDTDFAPRAVVLMVCRVKVGSAAPSFSYQATLLSEAEADRTSRSPSPSRSAAATDVAPLAVVLMVRRVKVGSAAPLFSYQA